jgi:hypothetical protein
MQFRVTLYAIVCIIGMFTVIYPIHILATFGTIYHIHDYSYISLNISTIHPIDKLQE